MSPGLILKNKGYTQYSMYWLINSKMSGFSYFLWFVCKNWEKCDTPLPLVSLTETFFCKLTITWRQKAMVDRRGWGVRVAIVLSFQFDPVDARRLTARCHHRGRVSVHTTWPRHDGGYKIEKLEGVKKFEKKIITKKNILLPLDNLQSSLAVKTPDAEIVSLQITSLNGFRG